MLQTLLVYCVVAGATLYVGWKFMPAALRSWCAARIGVSMRSCGLGRDGVMWLEAKLNSGGACGNCNSCKACDSDKRAIEPTAARVVQNSTRLPEP